MSDEGDYRSAFHLEWTLNFDDYRALINGTRRIPTPLVWCGFYIIVPGLFWYIVPSDVPISIYVTWPLWAYLAAVLLLPPLLHLVFQFGIYRVYFLYSRNAGRPIALGLGADGFEWTVDGMSGRIAWATINRVVEHPKRLIVYFSRREGMVFSGLQTPPAEWLELVRYVRSQTGGK